ncbi:MAG TPA: DUF4405 domain-containing protein [Desulfosporosinus sp.]
MNGKILTKIMLDLIMTILFVALIDAYGTGLVFHEIAGLSIVALFASHILLNWSWVKNVTRNLFSRRLKTSSRLTYALNVAMLLTVATTIITGILISKVVFPSMGFSLYRPVVLAHKWTSYFCLGLFGYHIALHRRYLVQSVRKIWANRQESNVGKTCVRLGATAFILVILYSRVFSIATRSENNLGSIYPSQIASSTQTTTSIEGRDDGSTNQVYDPSPKGGGETVGLSNYLGSMHCTACPKHCSLLSPQCGRANPQIKSAKIQYQALYGNTSS